METDAYFTNSRNVAQMFGDQKVKYATFMRRDTIAALDKAIAYIEEYYRNAVITRMFKEGEFVPANSVMFYVEGRYSLLSELETGWLQKIGLPCVCAYNAYHMTQALPASTFIDMHARHAPGMDMVHLAAYGASVGSNASKAKGAKGFIGSSVDSTAPYYGMSAGIGTMPHALVGYAKKDLVSALKMLVQANPSLKNVVALVDYNGQEITESLKAAEWFYSYQDTTPDMTFGVRLDTHGARYCEGLDKTSSYEALKKSNVNVYDVIWKILEHMDIPHETKIEEDIRKHLAGPGVSVANVYHVREQLNNAGFNDARIVASSGFDLLKCRVFSFANAPVDTVGTGSFLPKTFSETYATADTVEWDGVPAVKVGREFLIG